MKKVSRLKTSRFENLQENRENIDLAKITRFTVLDFVHGRSLRFQDFSFSYLQYERSLTVPNCLECGQLPDSTFHKLFECTAIRDVEGLREELRVISSYEMNFHLPLMFSKDKQVKSNFRKLVRAVIEQSLFGDELLV